MTYVVRKKHQGSRFMIESDNFPTESYESTKLVYSVTNLLQWNVRIFQIYYMLSRSAEES